MKRIYTTFISGDLRGPSKLLINEPKRNVSWMIRYTLKLFGIIEMQRTELKIAVIISWLSFL
jgi:hypothetical protein